MTEEPLTPNTDDIGARARTAVGWRALSQFSSQGIQIVTGIILARLLMPADFGIIGMAGIVTGLAGVFRDLGFGQALVQRAELRPEHSRSAFWMTLIMGGLLYAALYFGAPWAAEYFHDERVAPVLRLTALSFLISPFGTVPRSLLQRELDFRRPFWAGLAGTITSGAVGITLALLGHGYWSLVWSLLASSVVGTVALCLVTRYTPPLVPTLRGARELFSFGAGVTGVSIGYYIATNIDYLVIGRRLDADALGLYSKAYSFITYPAMLAGMVSPVFFPAFSRMQGDHSRMRSAYGRLTTLMATLFFPLLVIALIAAPELVPTVFGEQWTPSVVPAQILMLVGLCKITSSAADGAVKAAGRVYGQAWRQFLYGGLIGVGAWFTAPHGIVAVSIAVVGANIIHYTLIGHLVWSAIGFGVSDYARAFRGPITTTVVSASVALLCRWGALAMGYQPAPVLVMTTVPASLVAAILTLWVPLPEMRDTVREIGDFCRRGVRIARPHA